MNLEVKKYPNMPRWSGPMPKGPGSRGWFIYPTIRALQPEIIKEFEEISYHALLKEWSIWRLVAHEL